MISNATLEELLDDIGVEDINPRGDEIHARCPMHEQRTGQREMRPRHWSINRDTGQHYCFSCGYRGSLVSLVMDVGRQSMWDAQRLIRSYGVDFSSFTTLDPYPKQVEEPTPTLDLSERLELFGDPPLEAIQERGLCRRAVERYGVRWDSGEKGWVLPIRSPYGDVWGYQVKTKTAVLNHPPGCRKSKTLFGLDVLLLNRCDSFDEDYVVLVESPLDVVYLDYFGYPAVASFGAAVSDEQLRLVVSRFRAIVLALDNDTAGRSETRRILDTHWARQRPVEVLNYRDTKAKDPGECTEAEFVKAMDTATMSIFWAEA